MLKKYVGGLTLLVFTFTFVIPLLVGVNTADADYTNIYRQAWRTAFLCPDGTYATSSSGYTILNAYNQNHPEDTCEWKEGPYEDDAVCILFWCFGETEDILVCEHTKHDVTIYTDPVEDYTEVILWDNRHYCQDDDDEETIN